jgi:hypothetical protein
LRSPRALYDALIVGLTRALITALCLWSGFRAISDDDYSRVVIAQRFAAAPSLDPSGTSWLPLPFWLYGAPMWLLGDSLLTARVVAALLGVLSALLVWLSGRVLGLGERAALLGALAAALLPYGSWLSAATVPEAPTAALLLFGVISLARPEARLRGWGGAALGAACFCRYEAWAPALAFGLICSAQALRQRRRELWFPVVLALGPMGLWLLHGLVRHESALFFVSRVSQYRAALGQEPGGWAHALLHTPLSIVRFEPELVAVVAVALGLSLQKGRSPFARDALGPGLALLALLAFLIAASATGGSATHHPERSLLSIFWFLALLGAGLITKLAQEPAQTWRLPLLALPLALAGHLLLRPELRESFVDRREEEQVGTLLRSLSASRVALDSDDFGFFAIQAALGYGKSSPLSDLDPRKPTRPRPSSPPELAARLRQHAAAWLVTTRERQSLAAPLGQLRATTPRFAVIELDRQTLQAAP